MKNVALGGSINDMRTSLLRQMIGEKTIKSMEESQHALGLFMIDLRAELEFAMMQESGYGATIRMAHHA